MTNSKLHVLLMKLLYYFMLRGSVNKLDLSEKKTIIGNGKLSLTKGQISFELLACRAGGSKASSASCCSNNGGGQLHKQLDRNCIRSHVCTKDTVTIVLQPACNKNVTRM